MLRMWVLTVFTETESCLAISNRERFVGRYRKPELDPRELFGLCGEPGAGFGLAQT
jgi:hypothetical protein